MHRAAPTRLPQQSPSPYHARPNHQLVRPKGPGTTPILITAMVAIVVLGLVGVGAAAWLSAGVWSEKNSYVPAVDDALTLSQLRELAGSVSQAATQPKIPASIDESVIMLASRDRNDKRVFDLQQRIAAEYIYGSEVRAEKRDQVSQAIVTTYDLSFLDNQERVILLKAFRRWGTPEHLPQLFASQMGDRQNGLAKGYKGYGTDAILEHLLQAAKEHATVDVAPWLAGLLSSSVGGQAESVLRTIGDQASPYLIAIHDSEDTEAVTRTKRLFHDYGVDEIEVRIEHYLAQARDDSSWDRKAAYLKLAAIPFDQTYQDRIVDFLVGVHSADRYTLDSWLEAVSVWGDERCLPPVGAALRNGHYWDTTACLPFIKRFGDADSIGTLVDLLLADHYLRDRPAVAEALISLCNTHPDADVRGRVREPILRQVHDLYSHKADDIWRVLRATNFDTKLLVQQTLDDLGSPDFGRQRSAWETMSHIDVEGSMRDQAVQRMAVLLGDDSNPSRQQRTCFLRWAKPEHPLLMKWLQTGYLSSDDFRPVMEAVINAKLSPELVMVVADSLADRQRHEVTLQLLLAKCTAPAPLAVALLQSTNPTVLQVGCRVLATKGDEEHLQSLAELYRLALKARNPTVVAATKEAARMIRSRQNESGS
jgi:hypothetical protein